METTREGIVCSNLDQMDVVFDRTEVLHDTPTSYCPGCSHSVVHRLIMEVIEELGILGDTIGVAPVGCSVFAYHFMNIDMQQAAHGRATAVATGIKRVLPDKIVFSYLSIQLIVVKILL
jgi:2-oxoglutarate ferredoxin oxidoreductase subunit beta